MKKSEVLQKSLDAFGPNGENWIQFCAMKDAAGSTVHEEDEESIDAVFFCSGGAVIHFENPGKKHYLRSPAYGELVKIIGHDDIPRWNDHPRRTFADVRQLFQSAISAAKGAE